MHEEHVTYDCSGIEAQGFFVRPDGEGPRPLVVVAHTIMGMSDLARDKARALAGLGHAAFAWDLYGAKHRPPDKAAARPLMTELLGDRGGLLARRMKASIEVGRALAGVDGTRVAAAGYCFGGLCVLDLARMGADVLGVVSFHGIFTHYDFGKVDRHPKVLAIHGYDDPLADPDAMRGLCDELTELGIDWQLHAHGGTMHAFTSPDANDPDAGTVYDADADRRSWAAARGFLGELFG